MTDATTKCCEGLHLVALFKNSPMSKNVFDLS